MKLIKGKYSYPLPHDFGRELEITIQRNVGKKMNPFIKWILMPITEDDAEHLKDFAPGVPKYYAIWYNERTVRFYPTPNQTFKAEIKYFPQVKVR